MRRLRVQVSAASAASVMASVAMVIGQCTAPARCIRPIRSQGSAPFASFASARARKMPALFFDDDVTRVGVPPAILVPTFLCRPKSRGSVQISNGHRHSTMTRRYSMLGGEVLSSTKSSTVKQYKSLVSKKRKRTEERATVIEGQRLVFDMLSDPTTRGLVRHVMVEESALKNDDAADLVTLLQDLESTTSIKMSVGTRDVVKACSDTVTPQGFVAIASLPAPYEGEGRREEGSNNYDKSLLYLVLDGLSDPGNVGTLLRTALACGVAAVVLMPGSCDVWNPKAVRSAMGASFKVPLVHVESWEECKQVLTGYGVELECGFYAATMEGSEVEHGIGANTSSSSLAYYDVDWGSSLSGNNDQPRIPKAVCIGKEGPGLSAEIRKAVHRGEVRAVHVPMEQGIESLNAAVCGSVILFEAARQNRMTVCSK